MMTMIATTIALIVGFITGGGVAIGLMYDRMMRWRKR